MTHSSAPGFVSKLACTTGNEKGRGSSGEGTVQKCDESEDEEEIPHDLPDSINKPRKRVGNEYVRSEKNDQMWE